MKGMIAPNKRRDYILPMDPFQIPQADRLQKLRDCWERAKVPKCYKDYIVERDNWKSSTQPQYQAINLKARACHMKYVRGQRNKHGHPIYNIYDDHPNWTPYRQCMSEVDQLNQQVEQSKPQETQCVSDFIQEQRVLEGLYRKEQSDYFRNRMPKYPFHYGYDRPRRPVRPAVNLDCVKKCIAGVNMSDLGRGAKRAAKRSCNEKCVMRPELYANYMGDKIMDQLKRIKPAPLPDNYVELQVEKAKKDYKEQQFKKTVVSCVESCAMHIPQLKKAVEVAENRGNRDRILQAKGRLAYEQTMYEFQCKRHLKTDTKTEIKKYLPYVIGGVLLIMLLKD